MTPNDPSPEELEDVHARRRRSGLSQGERWLAVGLTAAVLALGLGLFASSAWSAVVTILASGEVSVAMPVRTEVPDIVDTDNPVVYSGGFTTAEFVLSNVETGSRTELALGRTLDAAVIGGVLVAIAAVGSRLILDRTFMKTAITGAWLTGSAAIVASILGAALQYSATLAIAAELRTSGINAVFPADVTFEPNWTLLAAGASLMLLALLLKVADRALVEIDDVI